MRKHHSIKRLLLYTVIGGLVLAAMIGIYVLLFGTFGRREVKIILTTLGISYFSVTSLACAAAYERRRQAPLAVLGLAVSIAGLAFFLPGLWAEWLETAAFAKTTAILAVLSFSFAHICLLSFATLQRKLLWVHLLAVASIVALAGIISTMILYEKGDDLVRWAGALAILDGCLSLCIPILHRLGPGLQLPLAAETYRQIELACPRCGRQATYPIGAIRCSRCSLEIDVHIRVPQRAGS
jgi:hypothetical protein